MASKVLPCQTLLRLLLDYDPETGVLTWKPRGRAWFKSERSFKAWNSTFSGKRAFGFIDDRGYHVSMLLRKRCAAHRVVWKLAHGKDPEDVDHINGDRSDNRLANLRSVSRLANTRNQRIPSNNTHGHIGVYLVKGSGRWRAQIRVKGELKNLGRFGHIEDAIAARKAAERLYGFHENHGRA